MQLGIHAADGEDWTSAESSSDLQNLLAATDIAMLFLDRELRIMRFTPKVSELFNVQMTDRGRRISDFTGQLGYAALSDDAQQVLKKLLPVQRELQANSGRWYLTRMLPYRSSDDRIEGIVITFVDITERRQVEDALRESQRLLAVQLDASQRFHSLAGKLLDNSELEPVYNEILRVSLSMLKADCASIQLFEQRDTQDQNQTGLRLLAQHGIPPENAEFWAWVTIDSKTTCGQVLSSGQRRIVTDVATSEFITGDDLVNYQQSDIRAIQSTPLFSRDGKLMGVISTHWRQPHRPQENELKSFDVVAHLAGNLLERIQTDEQLRNSKEYAESIIDTLHEPLLVLRPDLTVRSCNPAFYEHFGVKVEETRGRKIYDLGNGQWDIPELRTLLEDVLPDSNVFNDYEVDHEFESIGRRVMLLNARRLDHVQLILLGIRDITDRKQAEDALRKSESRYRLVVDQNLAGILQITLDGELMWANNRICQQLGYSKNEIEGRHLREIVHPDDLEASIDGLEKLTRQGQPFEIDKRLVSKDGTIIWVHNAVTPVRDDSGNVSHASIVSLDITERRIVEESLRESEDKLRKLNDELEKQVALRTSMLRILQDITRAANEARSVEAAMSIALERICKYNGWILGHVWRMADDDSGNLVTSGVWCVDPLSADTSETLDRMRRLSEQLRYSPGEGLIGAVLATGQAQWSEDLQATESRRQEIAAAIGLRGMIALPVYVNGEVAAVMEFFSQAQVTIDERFLEILPDVGIQLGQVIERKRLDRLAADAAEQEQRRIGQDIHDGVGQEIAGLKYLAQTHAEALQEAQAKEAAIAQRIAIGFETVQRHMRRIIRDLVPVEVDTAGLSAALRSLAERTREDFGIDCRFEHDESVRIKNSLLATHVFRIAQEAVSNVIKHASARQIEIHLTIEDSLLNLVVLDDGVGLSSTDANRESFGLRGMAYRAELVGGQFSVRSRPEGGTSVSCIIPLDAAE